MGKGPPSTSEGLRRRTWRRFLRGPDPELLEELYVPALAEAVRYDRCCAYFSSSVLAAASRGFGRFIERSIALGEAAPRPAVRLVVNEELPEEDARTLVESGDTSQLERCSTSACAGPRSYWRDNAWRFFRAEISRGGFSRTIRLPQDVDFEKTAAEFKDGMLEIHLPKTQKTDRRRIEVK